MIGGVFSRWAECDAAFLRFALCSGLSGFTGFYSDGHCDFCRLFFQYPELFFLLFDYCLSGSFSIF